MKIIKVKRKIKLVPLILLTPLLITLTSCEGKEPVRKEVSLTHKKLEAKLDKLVFSNQEDSLVKTNLFLKSTYENHELERNFSREAEIESVIDTNSRDLWLDLEYNYEEYEGAIVLGATLKGFESTDYTYFDINYQYNENLDDNFRDIEAQGKYKIKKVKSQGGWYLNSLSSVASKYGVHLTANSYVDFEIQKYNFVEVLILKLHSYYYEGLKFFKEGDKFDIELKVNLNDLKSARVEIVDTILAKYYLSVSGLDVFEKFDVYYIYSFEKNRIVEIDTKIEIKYSDGEYGIDYINHDSILTTNTKYIKTRPEEIKYSDYISIDALEETIK